MQQRTNTKKKKLGSYPSTTVIISVALSLTVIGLVASVALHAYTLSDYLKRNIEIHIYLKNHTSDNEILKTKTILSAKPYVSKVDGIPQITYISQKEAIKRFISETGEDFTELLDISPIKASVILKIDPQFSGTDKMNYIREDLENMHAVFEVDLNKRKEKEIKLIHDNINKILVFLLVFSAISIVTIIVLIDNTLKIALFSQRFLIRSMQLVGATSYFIKKPFIISALSHGFTGGLIASLIISSILQYAYQEISDLSLILNLQAIIILLIIIPIIGALISLISAYKAVNKYLKMSLDDLY